ncbi:ECF transporter S component [Siminovitchia acidinfaciens]|uniref:ECF transporter S component n=1 Tax=Siminovitchia acidinfaciens TaxID=2321395 RepID=A0A429XV86_9BACI|nr:ECF transporter S component [Siminovitchia acidinfaciens]RST72086.1 ECF transporter S component [Siminovitchia acidinfaciens]
MERTATYSGSRTKTFDLIITSMLTALVFVATMLLNIKLPISINGGLVHLGSAMLFISAIVFGPKKGAFAGAVGMGLFDLVSGWALWAPITILTRALQGYIVGKIAWSKGRNGNSIAYNLFGIILSVPPMIAGYYLWESIIYGNWIVPLTSIPGDILQSVIGIAVAIPVCIVLKKIPAFK